MYIYTLPNYQTTHKRTDGGSGVRAEIRAAARPSKWANGQTDVDVAARW